VTRRRKIVLLTTATMKNNSRIKVGMARVCQRAGIGAEHLHFGSHPAAGQRLGSVEQQAEYEDCRYKAGNPRV